MNLSESKDIKAEEQSVIEQAVKQSAWVITSSFDIKPLPVVVMLEKMLI